MIINVVTIAHILVMPLYSREHVYGITYNIKTFYDRYCALIFHHISVDDNNKIREH